MSTKPSKTPAAPTLTPAELFASDTRVTLPSMELKELKTYQPVSFNKQLDSFFTAKRSGMEGLKITYYPTLQLIKLDLPKKDLKLVVPANVQYMEPAEDFS